MHVPQILFAGFGLFSLVFICLLGWQVIRRELASMKQAGRVPSSAEGIILLAITAAIGTRYCLELIRTAAHGSLPVLSNGWIAVFATGCAIYVGSKMARALKMQSK